MSRIIVKNLPNNVDANKLREKFNEFGYVTDLQLKYTPQGKFRKFGFVGYESVEQANAAVHHFNNSFLGTARLKVELCSELGDIKKPKAWSKYSKERIANEKQDIVLKCDSNKKKNKSVIKDEEIVEQIRKHKDDPEFLEFMEIHGKVDTVMKLNTEDDEEKSDDDVDNSAKNNVALADISDLEYLKSKIKGNNVEVAAKIIKDDQSQKSKNKEYFTVKISNLPYSVTKKDIRRMLNPLSPASLRLPPRIKGIAYVGFDTEKEKKKALIKNKTFLKGKQLAIVDFKTKTDSAASNEDRWREQEDALKNEENIAESGRIFIRNLAYSINEEEVQNLFSKYGPIAEIVLPVDRISRQLKGYGIITFVMPEHAVAAYTSLDGTILHGRMLHLLPGKSKENTEETDGEKEDTNYKNKALKKLKAKAGSSHNWNTLFLDLNAVAEVIAEKYNVTKENVLTGSDAAVRLALGETQLVYETKKFLEENGVKLDAFNQEVKTRSKTVILVKNLPANSTVSEIRKLFAKYGELGRVILPPSGITGLVEFLEPSEARIAYKCLAYSKFKHLPLYLEWAPDDSLSNKEKPNPKQSVDHEEDIHDNEEQEAKNDVENEDDDEDIIPEPDATLFVKNLHFDTTEEDLKEYFKSCGKIISTIIARKKDTKSAGTLLSLGYGFVHFYSKASLNEAMRRLQGSTLKDRTLELKRSNRTLPEEFMNVRKKTNVAKQTGTKIMVRNIPFQATANEIRDLFKIFGELKFVRLPKKLVGTGSHRGFAFVEFVSKSDAKRAMESLCQSTHLLGRRLVLEWAESDEDVQNLRKRTAKHYHDDSRKKSKVEILEEKQDEMLDEEDI